MNYILIITGAVLLLLLIINIADLNRFVVSQYSYTDKRIKKDIRFVVLSDLHNKTYGKENHKLREAIEKLQPDVILCVGDMMTATPEKDNSRTADFVAGLAKKYPTYYAMGNHEYRASIYPQTYGDMYEKFCAPLLMGGVKILDNEHLYLQECNVDLCGLTIDRRYYKRFSTQPMEPEYLSSVISQPRKDAYEILLAHNPEYCREYATWGADLTLCGHIHGGLIRLPGCGGIASPAVKFFPRYNGGEYTFGDNKALVSRGLGTHTLPLRLFDPGELIVLELHPAQE